MARRLTVVLAADVVGYSKLMGEDEAGTLAALKAHRREMFDPVTAKRGGRIVKLMGDGVLAEFPSVVDAVECAIEVQRSLADEAGKIKLRIGINLGDIIADGDDIYGEGINVAARLEALAEPGGICISSIVHESLGNRVEAGFVDAGEHQAKNISKPIRVWRWSPGPVSPPRAMQSQPANKRSIVVLPFANMSSGSEQEFFADGITEDLITELSRFRSLVVISRNSAFAFKGKSIDLKDVSQRLGARYVVEGSVRRSGDRLRITTQLIDAFEDAHLWAERYDRQMQDIFAVQDEVVRAIVTTIEPQLLSSERNRALRKPPESLDAWESYQRGMWYVFRYKPEDRETALTLIEQAIKLDPRFAAAFAGLAQACYSYVLLNASPDPARDVERGIEAAKMAINLDEHDPSAYTSLARCYMLQARHESATTAAEQAIQLNPNFAAGYFARGHSLWHQGRPHDAIAPLEEAIRLGPYDPLLWAYMASKAIALVLKGDLLEAIACSRQAQQQGNAAIFAHVGELCGLGLMGRLEEAADAVMRAKSTMPGATIGYLIRVLPISDAECRQSLVTGLRSAGLPD